jgi:hypothetical protein
MARLADSELESQGGANLAGAESIMERSGERSTDTRLAGFRSLGVINSHSLLAPVSIATTVDVVCRWGFGSDIHSVLFSFLDTVNTEANLQIVKAYFTSLKT